MVGEIRFNPPRKHLAAGLRLQIFVSADMVCVGMGIVYRLELPAVAL